MFETEIDMIELPDDELDLVAAGDTNQGNQFGLVNVNVQDNNVAVLSGGFIQAT